MYDIIARRRLSTVLRYIFDFLPKEETSIHLNTKKAVLSDRRNSDTEPYIMLNIFFVEDIFSPRWAEANKSRRCVLPGLRLSGSGQAAFPLPLFSRLSASAFYRATVCVTKLFNTDTAPLRRQTYQDALPCPVFVFPVPGKPRFPFRSFLSPFGFRFFTAPPYAFQNSSILPQLRCGGRQIKTPYTVRLLSSRSPANFVSPSALFSHLSVSAFLLHHRMRFKTLQYCPSSVAAADKSRRRTLSGFCLPGPRQTSFPLPLFSRLSASAFYRATVCVSKLFNTDTAPLRQQINQGALPCPVFVFPVSGKLRFPFRSFLSPFGFRFFTAPPYAFQNSSILPQLRCGGRQIKTPYTVRHLSSGSRQTSFPLPLFSRLSVSAFYRATVCVSKLFNADTAPLRRQTIKAPYTVRLLSSRSPANLVSPSALFSHLSVSAFLLHHRMRFKTLQYCPSSVAAADKSRRRTLSGFCLPVPGT